MTLVLVFPHLDLTHVLYYYVSSYGFVRFVDILGVDTTLRFTVLVDRSTKRKDLGILN